MTVQDIRNRVRAAAGVGNPKIPVRFIDHPRAIPPTLRRPTKRKLDREVVVSAIWLREKQPEWWSALMVARLLHTEEITFEQLRIPKQIKPQLVPKASANPIRAEGLVVTSIEIRNGGPDVPGWIGGFRSWGGKGYILALPRNLLAIERLQCGEMVYMDIDYADNRYAGNIRLTDGVLEDGRLDFSFDGIGALNRIAGHNST
jgi:hypothetical protein